MYIAFVLLGFVAIATLVTVEGYVNDWDQPFTFACPTGQAISYVSSVHDNRREDRRWEFHCRNIGRTEYCYDSGYVNNFDQPIVFNCPGNKFMTGVYSYHNNRHEDRRFGFQCCEVSGRTPHDCITTDYVNDWDQKLTLVVPDGKVIKGAYSHHNNRREDRRWQYQICTL